MGLKNILAATATAVAITTDTKKLLKGLNPEQEAAVVFGKGPILVAAVAGAGKTRALVHRVAYLVAQHKVNPSRILAVTFSKAGADEMNDRLQKMLPGSGARIGTFHSVALEICRAEIPGVKDWEIDSKDRYRYCVKDAAGFRELDWKACDLNMTCDYISFCKSNMARPYSEEAMEIARERYYYQHGPKKADPAMLNRVYERAEELRRDRQLLTFDDMMLDAAELLQENEPVRKRWARRWDWVLQDEAQDQNRVQLVMGELLAKDHRNYLLVGDPAQCHPAGTKILTDDGEVSIENLSDGDTVKAWNRKAQRMVGGRRVRVGKRHYDGPLVGINLDVRSVRMTPDHKVLARWTDRDDRDTCVVYLMYREGLGYRVGWCQLFASRGDSRNCHLVTRAKLEKADKAWVLHVAHDRTDASVMESIISVRYGIPTFPFEPVEGAQHLTRESIDRLFREVGHDSIDGGEKALHECDLDPGLPLWPWPQQQVEGKGDDEVAYRRGTYFPVYAANVLPGLMSLPLPDDRNLWAPVDEVWREDYHGLVYSLDVEQDHSYAANEIVVLNCIYAWRGAMPSMLLSFEDRWNAKVVKMSRNYRCGQAIIDTANRVLDAMDPSTRLDMHMVCEKGTQGQVLCRQYINLDEEADGIASEIAEMIQDGTQPKDCAILYRTNAQSRAPEEALISRRIPYMVVGGTNFYNRKEVKDLLAYLRIAEGRGTLDDVRRCINAPFRFLGKAFVEKVSAVAKKARAQAKRSGKRVHWPSVVREACDQGRVQYRQRNSAEEWANILTDCMDRIAGQATAQRDTDAWDAGKPVNILEDIVLATRYTDWLVKDEGEETTENSRVSNVRELIRAARRFPTAKELLDFIDDLNEASKGARQKGEKPNKVILTTLHRSKGLEWENVFMSGVNEAILPHARSEDIEEERRLFYVGCTRAKERLSISCVGEIAVGDRLRFVDASPFIYEAGLTPVPMIRDELEEETVPSLRADEPQGIGSREAVMRAVQIMFDPFHPEHDAMFHGDEDDEDDDEPAPNAPFLN